VLPRAPTWPDVPNLLDDTFKCIGFPILGGEIGSKLYIEIQFSYPTKFYLHDYQIKGSRDAFTLIKTSFPTEIEQDRTPRTFE
jgi:hypothetical protein